MKRIYKGTTRFGIAVSAFAMGCLFLISDLSRCSAAAEDVDIVVARVIGISRCKEQGNEGHNSQRYGYYALLKVGRVLAGKGIAIDSTIALRIGGYWESMGGKDALLPRKLQSDKGDPAYGIHVDEVICVFTVKPDPNEIPPKGIDVPLIVPVKDKPIYRIINDENQRLIARPLLTPLGKDLSISDFEEKLGVSLGYPPKI